MIDRCVFNQKEPTPIINIAMKMAKRNFPEYLFTQDFFSPNNYITATNIELFTNLIFNTFKISNILANYQVVNIHPDLEAETVLEYGNKKKFIDNSFFTKCLIHQINFNK